MDCLGHEGGYFLLVSGREEVGGAFAVGELEELRAHRGEAPGLVPEGGGGEGGEGDARGGEGVHVRF